VKYEKPFLGFAEQADLLTSRGLVADRSALIARLESVNYYRLSGYLFPFRSEGDRFLEGTTLAQVWNHYLFDRRFRLLCLDAIERIEVAVRTQLAYRHAQIHGPFGYARPEFLPGLDRQAFDHWLGDLLREFNQSGEIYARHYRQKYADSQSEPPIWMAVEQMTLGKTVTFYRGTQASIQTAIANEYHVPDRVFLSWLKTLNEVRNVCAHHGRLWNRDLGNNPLLPNPRKYLAWHSPKRVAQNKMFVVILILRHGLRIAAPTSSWPRRLESLIDSSTDVPIAWMGFPDDWKEHALWR
jgi:abortive infection bacteriophage resistance protein